MPVAVRCFPESYVPPLSTFNLLLLSEGFLQSEESLFIKATVDLRERLLAATPFNLTRYRPSWINVFRRFISGAARGPASGATAGNTPFRSTLNGGVLSLDTGLVEAEVAGLTIKGEEGDPDTTGPDLWPLGNMGPRSPGAVIILLPADANGETYSAALGSVEFVATTTNSNWHQVALRAIGSGLWLGDEWEASGAAFEAPSAAVGRKLNGYPNLCYLDIPFTGAPPKEFKWLSYLDGTEQVTPLTMVTHKQPTSSPDATPYGSPAPGIKLVEGAGGYRTKVYRSGLDCLMRRRIGSSTLSPKVDRVGFCTVCRGYLTNLIAGTASLEKRRSFRNQTIQFDDVTWSIRTEQTSGFPPPSPTSTPGPGPHWEFDLLVGPADNGLKFQNLKLRTLPDSDRGEDVAASVSFSDLGVTFQGESTPRAFDVTKAFSNPTPPRLSIGRNGNASPIDDNYLWGAKLEMHEDFGGSCPVRVELSLVLKGPRADIEPTGIVQAVKFLPQIGLTWSDEKSQRVKAMRGTVRIVVNNTMVMSGMTMPPSNVANFLTDSNTSQVDRRKKAATGTLGDLAEDLGNLSSIPALNLLRLIRLFPNWSDVFDFYRGNVTKETILTGVYGPDSDATKLRKRSAKYTWPRGASTAINLEKVPRQGAQDNVHVHGFMAADPNDPTGGPMIHAPACGEACFHLHWRWGHQNVLLAAIPKPRGGPSPSQFRGWSAGIHGEANAVTGAPLIPPNQHLRVALSPPGASRSHLDGLSGTGAVKEGTATLPKWQKELWYMVDIVKPRPNERQVILEQGIGWGFDYNIHDFVGSSVEHALFEGLYKSIRWFGPGQAQVPEGTEASTSGPTMEDL